MSEPASQQMSEWRMANNRMEDSPFAIIIVNWNVRDMLAACLRSVEADLTTSQLLGQIWVVDNASTDDSVAMLRRDFPQVQLIASHKNLGFAGGNNAALRAIGFADKPPSPKRVQGWTGGGEPHPPTPPFGRPKRRGGESPLPVSGRGPEGVGDETKANLSAPESKREGAGGEVDLPEAILLLNPDTEVHPGALRALFDFLKNNPHAGIVGARLIYGNGSFQHSVFAFPGLWQLAIELLPLPGRLVESSLNGRYPRSVYESGRPFRVGHPLGAAMCVRREAIQQVGLLDEHYQMYVEEIDWSKRIVSAGWEAYCVPAAEITHFGGQSTNQVQISSFINLWSSRRQFYRKHYHPLKFWLAAQIVRMGMRRKAVVDSQAAGRGELSQAELAQRLSGYKQVINIWQDRAE